jgi:hypothetical protein
MNQESEDALAAARGIIAGCIIAVPFLAAALLGLFN